MVCFKVNSRGDVTCGVVPCLRLILIGDSTRHKSCIEDDNHKSKQALCPQELTTPRQLT